MIVEVGPKFEESTIKIGARALCVVDSRYEQNQNPEYDFQYHRVRHSALVALRFKSLAEEIYEIEPEIISRRDILLGEALAKGHDRFIAWYSEPQIKNEIKRVLMKRLGGYNEETSAFETIGDMRKINLDLGTEIFTTADEQVCLEAYGVTIPGFSPENKTVYQPRLSKDSSLVARLIAFADLGSAGLWPLSYIKDGNNLFREEQLDIFRKLTGAEPITEEERKDINERIELWSHSQVDFALGRGILFEQELGDLPGKVKDILRSRFSKFSASAEAALNIAQARERMTFAEKIHSMGYLTSDTRSRLINQSHLLSN